ncbi:COMM domain-containing protein 3-like [Liolophura sinensis]|uniref:COMM domain-containing protein 3-like n=1 Tax=Liolophura sinensis TaxID=3198878 RepID=UPI0031582166
MELSSNVLENLSVAGDSAHIPDKQFSRLVTKACEGVLENEHRNDIEGDEAFKDIDKAVLKEAYSGLVTLVIEAAKHDVDTSSMGSVLEECKFTSDRIDTINKIYQTRKPYLQMLLGRIGTALPHIVDCKWRLDYYIKNNHLEKVNEPVYLIALKVQVAPIFAKVAADYAEVVPDFLKVTPDLFIMLSERETSS